MATPRATDGYFSGGGKLYFKEQGSGAFIYFGRTSGITLTTSVEYKDAYNTETQTQLLGKRLSAKTDVAANFSTDEVTSAAIAIAFSGEKITTTQPIGAAVAVVLTGAVVGGYHPLEVYDISNIEVKDETDTTTFIDGVDYSLAANSGLLHIIESGAITDGDNLNLTLDYPEKTYAGVAAYKKATLEGQFLVVTDTDTNNDFNILFKRMSVALDGDFGLKNPDEYGTLPFSGSALIDTTTVSGTWSDFIDFVEIDPEN